MPTGATKSRSGDIRQTITRCLHYGRHDTLSSFSYLLNKFSNFLAMTGKMMVVADTGAAKNNIIFTKIL
jgi:acetate kinase